MEISTFKNALREYGYSQETTEEILKWYLQPRFGQVIRNPTIEEDK